MELGIVVFNGWQDKEIFGFVKFGFGEFFWVEYGVIVKNFVGMFLGCWDGYLEFSGGVNVIQGIVLVECYVYVFVIYKDGFILD